jgi:hypothetical protein
MTEPDRTWNVFISYAREEHQPAQWLYDKLQTCATREGRRPSVFLDTGREGVMPGADWLDSLMMALETSSHIVPLYSHTYFEREMCRWELRKAFDLNQLRNLKIIPVLLESTARQLVPHYVNMIQWQGVTDPDWFERLREALGLETGEARRRLRFRTPVADVPVSHTLPPVAVQILDGSGSPIEAADRVSLTAEEDGAILEGTLDLTAAGGAATFADLSFAAPADQVRLVASAPGCDPVRTSPFRVHALARPAVEPESPEHPRFAEHGRPIFLPDGRSLAVLGDGRLTVFPRQGEPASVPLAGRSRLWARGETCLAVADWSGRVTLARPDGMIRTFDLSGSGLSVPGGLSFDGDELLVGLWNGALWSISPGRAAPEPRGIHPPGVQALAHAGEHLLVGLLDGTVCVLSDGRRVAERHLEQVLLGVRLAGGHAIVAGERHVHRLNVPSGAATLIKPPMGRTIDARFAGDSVVILDSEGRGVRVNSELTVRAGFHTVRGARLTDADRSGQVLIFSYPNGSHVLMDDGRVVFTSDSGPLAVSPDGQRVALSDSGGITVVRRSELTA